MQDIHEKISLRGIEALTDEELLSILLEDRALAVEVLTECGSLSTVATTPSSRLRMIGGLGNKRTERIQSAVEIGRRVVSANKAIEETITSSDDVVSAMRPLLKVLTSLEMQTSTYWQRSVIASLASALVQSFPR